jgi:hypothetical protein
MPGRNRLGTIDPRQGPQIAPEAGGSRVQATAVEVEMAATAPAQAPLTAALEVEIAAAVDPVQAPPTVPEPVAATPEIAAAGLVATELVIVVFPAAEEVPAPSVVVLAG